MAVLDQTVTPEYALYNGDSCEILPTLPDASIHLSVYSPPFATARGGALYEYSSSERDLSNSRTLDEFMEHYSFLVRELFRLTLPGRLSCVHCIEVPGDGANLGGDTYDFPGDLIALHKRLGWNYAGRHCVWKDPLEVRNRTMAKGLAHCQIVADSTLCDVASADYLLLFRKPGVNAVPVGHPQGLTSYAGARPVPAELMKYRGWKGRQTENRYSHWVWRQYASCFWDDVRLERVLPYKESREPGDLRHMHPLQLDVVERCVVLRSNPGEVVCTPFMGVGSEAFGAVVNGRKAIGCELKSAFYRQAVRNLAAAAKDHAAEQATIFDGVSPEADVAEPPA